MSSLATPVPGETLAEAGERIRAAAPIRGERATDEDCRIRRDLIADTLRARGIGPGAHIWNTAQLVDGHVVGVWADSLEEAELELTVWWGACCHWVRADPQCRLLQEYLPLGKRSASDADRRFPLGPPRRLRDQFAPASDLLDGFWTGAGRPKSEMGR